MYCAAKLPPINTSTSDCFDWMAKCSIELFPDTNTCNKFFNGFRSTYGIADRYYSPNMLERLNPEGAKHFWEALDWIAANKDLLKEVYNSLCSSCDKGKGYILEVVPSICCAHGEAVDGCAYYVFSKYADTSEEWRLTHPVDTLESKLISMSGIVASFWNTYRALYLKELAYRQTTKIQKEVL